jgi:N4-gp56 family major capsid protein
LQFCDVKDASQQGKSKGATFHWNVFQNVATQGTKLKETKTMPETQFTITQGTLTIDEFGNSVPYSEKLDNLSEQPVKEIINKVLKNDAKKAFDIAAHAQFNNCVLRVVPTSKTSTTAITLTTNGTATVTNNIAFRKAHVGLIVDTMKERNIPPYVEDDYYALGWPSTFRTLKTLLEGVYQYTTEGFRQIMNGEIGRYDNCRFVEQTHIPKGGAADSSTFNANTNTADAWNNVASDWIFFFGEDTIAEAIAVPEEMRGKIPGDYGRSKGVAWYYLGGFGIVHTSADQCRILKWDSAV